MSGSYSLDDAIEILAKKKLFPRSKIVPGDGDPRHGTANGYNNLGCRCPDCTEANTIAHLAYMHRSGKARPHEEYLLQVKLDALENDNHGTETRYCYGCRCSLCRYAASIARAARRYDSANEADSEPKMLKQRLREKK